MRYQFTDASGNRWQGRQEISEDLYAVLHTSKPDRDIVIRYCRGKPGLSVISLSRLRNDFLVSGGIASVAWALLVMALIAQRRENSAIVAALRRRIRLDTSRRGPARAGTPASRNET